jgi:hypothetical protein
MGVCFMLVVLKQFFLPNLKVATILLCLAFVYGELRQHLAGWMAALPCYGACCLYPCDWLRSWLGDWQSQPQCLCLPPILTPACPSTSSAFPCPADVWWVFLQPLVTGGASVMIEVATGGSTHEQLPMVLRIPHHPLGINPAFALLGLGEWLWGVQRGGDGLSLLMRGRAAAEC